MKRVLLLIAIFCSAISANAQFGGGNTSTILGKISGTVIDSVTKKPLEYATISVFRTGGKAPINGVITDDKGNFKLNNLPPAKYKISITFIGYPTKTIDPVETTLSKPDNNMGTISVAPSTKTLNQVNIVGEVPLIENKIDKIVFNAEKDVTSQGGNATDVLRKVPLVAVDINGGVSVRGDQNVRVLINGKPSGAMSNNLGDVLKSFPADQIKSIEVVTSPSAKYDAEGTGGIINIITKSKNISGVSGSISGGFGTRQNNGNANLNIKQNRLSITGSFGGNYTWPQSTPTIRESYNSLSDITNNQNATNKVERYAYTGSGEVSYDFNNYNAIHSTIRFNQGGFKAEGFTDFLTRTPTLTNTYRSENNSKTVFGGYDWVLDYTHKFKKEGHQIVASGQWSHSITDLDYGLKFFNTSTQPKQDATNGGTNNEYTGQLDYTLPITDKFKLEAGGKSISRIISSNSDININDEYRPDASNLYDYNQYVTAGYTVLTFTLPKAWSLQTGARYEITSIDGRSASEGLQFEPVEDTYYTFVPSFAVSKTFGGTQTFKLTYSKRIQRPSLQFLNPFVNRLNPQNISYGNPALAPEVSQTVEFNYSTFIRSSVINASVYYKNTKDLIEGSTLLPAPGETFNRTTYNNIGQNNSVGMSFFGSITPIKPLTFRTSVNVFTYNGRPYSQFDYLQVAENRGAQVMYNIFGNGTLTLPKGFVAETFAILNSPTRSIQGRNPSFGFIGFGVRKEILNKKASIGLNTLSPFKENIDFNQRIASRNLVQTSNTAFPFRSVGVTFSYNFGKVTFKQDNPMAPKKTGLNDDLKSGGDQGAGGQQ
ncbi:TonB-dependent receptor domain-containing protein [Mucilaginibacter myungsuensis]|uniref:TonB-dependent receptor n=1 Tax=Mucilaginibacter myungsuensis TaxID=649104 RepID=A0A929L142_9SPHI|nr:TonB-dependent receptor [Mucilaginibacter myungsuensis]MBE9662190.1 TonB-dependent receptor [Mucilaginibacter myungsuensis]MDN3599376.1 TonB-dependent receptor [Mucilaginibacter myungsuensis]